MRSPVFLGLARPPKYLGLPIDYLVILMLSTMIPFVLSKSLLALAGGAVVYPVLWVISEREPRFITVVQVSLGTVRGTSHAA